jgi:hypothetical protein
VQSWRKAPVSEDQVNHAKKSCCELQKVVDPSGIEPLTAQTRQNDPVDRFEEMRARET